MIPDDKDLEIMNLEHENKLLKKKCSSLIDLVSSSNADNMMNGFDYIIKLSRKLWESEKVYGNSSEEAYADRHAVEVACRLYSKCFGNMYIIKLEGTVLSLYAERGNYYTLIWKVEI